MKGAAVGRTASSLPWLCPSAEALLTLGDAVPDVSVLESDLAFAAHVARFARPSLTENDSPFHKAILTQPSLAGSAGSLLHTLNHKNQLRYPSLPADLQKQLDAAVEHAEMLAQQLARPMPVGLAGWAVRLSMLGWAALSSVDSRLVHDCWHDANHREEPQLVERNYFGFDSQAVLRRLVSAWRFPNWLAKLLTNFHLPTQDLQRLEVPIDLARILCEVVPTKAAQVSHVSYSNDTLASEYPKPEQLKLIVRMLKNTAEIRRKSAENILASAEERIDQLTELLRELRHEFDHELRDAKLSGLAEFAAGAGHEINNPLTIISGNTQLILAKETDPGKQKALATIIRQTKRIYDILQGTRHFARPLMPRKEMVDLCRWLPTVVNAYERDADLKGLSLTMDLTKVTTQATVSVDVQQLRQAIGNVIQNGIDAAPRGGWVQISLHASLRNYRIYVEDNGPGPRADQLDHLFDPFFSGRDAGRGRGLGLSIAWRLLQINDGDIRFCRTTDGPTRFIISLPISEASAPRQARSA